MGCSCSKPSSKNLIKEYEILKEIGKGGFSKIYKAKKGERIYAMKEFNKENEKEYENEKSILEKFEHNNNIIKYIDSFKIEDKKEDIIEDKKFYIILEYCKSD